MSGEVADLSRTDAFEDSSELLLRSLAQGDTNYLDELFPTDEVSEVADVADQLVTRVHVQALQTSLEALAVDSVGHYCLGLGMTQKGYLFKRFVEVVQVVDFKAVQAVFLDQIRDVLRTQKRILTVQSLK